MAAFAVGLLAGYKTDFFWCKCSLQLHHMQSTVDITPMETTWYLKKLLILWSPNYFEISLQIIVLCSRVNLEGKEYGGTIHYLSTRKSNFKTHYISDYPDPGKMDNLEELVTLNPQN